MPNESAVNIVYIISSATLNEAGCCIALPPLFAFSRIVTLPGAPTKESFGFILIARLLRFSCSARLSLQSRTSADC